MLTWIFWKIPSPCYISFHEPCQVAWGHATNWVEGGDNYIHFHDSISLPHYILTSLIQFLHHYHSIFSHLPFTIHQHLFSNDTLLHFASYAILACFINITKGLSYAHYDFQWVFTLLLKKREQKMKWMLLTQEPTFFVFMVVTQEPTIRKCKLLLMSFTYSGNIHY